MTIKAALYTYLTAQSAVTSVVGQRVYPQQAPMNAQLPYITYQRIADPVQHHFEEATALASPTIQFDCWAKSDVEMQSVSEALRNVLDGFRGTMATVDVRSTALVSQDDTIERPDDGSEQSTFRTTMDFDIWYARAVPNALNPA